MTFARIVSVQFSPVLPLSTDRIIQDKLNKYKNLNSIIQTLNMFGYQKLLWNSVAPNQK